MHGHTSQKQYAAHFFHVGDIKQSQYWPDFEQIRCNNESMVSIKRIQALISYAGIIIQNPSESFSCFYGDGKVRTVLV